MRMGPLAVAAMLVLGASLQASPARAVPGCCKQRQTESGPWFATRLSFDECEQRNRAEGDDLFAPKGRVWWDTYC